MQTLRRFRTRRDEGGAVLILGALFASVAIIAAALSIDIGALVLEKRSNQRVADLAALDAVRGLTATAPQRDDVERIALASADRNGFALDASTRECALLPTPSTGATYFADGDRWMKIEIGKYTPGADDNFVPRSCPVLPALEALLPTDADAVRVTVSSPVSFNFIPGGGRETATAVAKLGSVTTPPATSTTTAPTSTTTTTTPTQGLERAGVRVGSRMASISTTQAAVLNAILALANNPDGVPLGTPGNLAVTAVGYDGLAGASMSVEELATELGISAGTVDQVLTSQFSYSDLLAAMITIADRNNQDEVALTLGELYDESIPLDFEQRHQDISLDEFLGGYGSAGAQTFNGSSVAEGAVNVLELVRGGAVLADGDHLVDAPLSGTVPLPTGATGATASVQLIEATQYKYDALTFSVSTAQLRTTLTLTVPVDLGSLGSVTVNVPVDIDGGGATATAAGMTCNAAHDTALTETITADANILTGQTAAWTVTANLVTVPLLGTTVPVTITAAPGSVVPTDGTSGSFVFSNQTAGGSAPYFTDVRSITPARLGALDMNASMLTVAGLPLSIPVGNVTGPIVTAVNGVLADLNGTVMDPLYDAFGVGFSNADVSPTQESGQTLPECVPGTTPTTGPAVTTTTVAAPPTTTAGSTTWSGVPVLVD